MTDAFICDFARTPIGRFGGALAMARPDDLATVPLKALMARQSGMDWEAVDDVILGCANQAGEDNRNVARMSLLLAGLPYQVPGSTINRLCGSGLNAVWIAANAIKAGDGELFVAGGVESMSRAPFVMPKAESAFSRNVELYDIFTSREPTRTPLRCARSKRRWRRSRTAGWARKWCRSPFPSARAIRSS